MGRTAKPLDEQHLTRAGRAAARAGVAPPHARDRVRVEGKFFARAEGGCASGA